MKKQNTSRLGLKENEIRATFVIGQDSLERIKTYSWITDIPVKEIIEEALNDYTQKENVKALIDKALSLKKKREDYK